MSSPLPCNHAAPRKRRVRRILFVTGLVAVLGLSITPTLTDSSWSELVSSQSSDLEPLRGVPADDAAKGVVYAGLKPAPKGDKCVGVYRVAGTDLCTHGPDPAPEGLNPRVDVKPVAPGLAAEKPPVAGPVTVPTLTDLAKAIGAQAPASADSPLLAAAAAPPGAPATPAASGVVCEGDGRSGKRVQILYLYEAGTPSRFNQYLPSFRTWAAGIDVIYDASAKLTGGTRHVRFVTTPDCVVDVLQVELPARSLGDFGSMVGALSRQGYSSKDRKYLLFADSKVYCGLGDLSRDSRPGPDNANNNVASYARVDTGCWGSVVAAHELTHNLGAVQSNAPHRSANGHCTMRYDLMCYADGPGVVMIPMCMDQISKERLDCAHDDYFSTSPKPGGYLASHWNVANSGWLIGAGGGPNPNPSPVPTPSKTATLKPSPSASVKPPPSPSATATRTPGPSPTGSTTPLPAIVVGNLTQTGVELSWPAAAAGTRYTVSFDGRSIGTTESASVRVTGMRPATDYRVSVTVGATPYTAELKLRTPAATTPVGGQVTIANAVTGQNVDLTASRSADGTPIIAYAPHGYANQRWTLVPAAGDTVLIRSVASGKCVASLGAPAAGAPLVQYPCDPQAAGQRWKLTLTSGGYTLSVGGFDVGIAADGRQLALQTPGAQAQTRVQHWSLTSV